MGDHLAGDGFSPFSLWPASRSRVADLQAGRAQLLFEMLYHGLITLGHFVPKQRGGGYA